MRIIILCIFGTMCLFACMTKEVKTFNKEELGCRVYLSTLDAFAVKRNNPDTLILKAFQSCEKYIDLDYKILCWKRCQEFKEDSEVYSLCIKKCDRD